MVNFNAFGPSGGDAPEEQPRTPQTGGFNAFAPVSADAALPQADDDGGSFLGSLAGAGADAFRGFVPEQARDVAGAVINNTLSGERFLNTVGGVVGDNDQLGTDIHDKLQSIDKIGGLLAIGFDVAAAPATILTAGFGGEIAAGLAGATRFKTAASIAAAVVEPVAAGNVAQRFAAEAILGTGVDATSSEVAQRLEGANPIVRGVTSLAMGALGGTTALRVTRNKLPALVGRQISIDASTTIDAFRLGEMTSDLRLVDVVPSAKNADEILENVGFMGRLKKRVTGPTNQQPGFAERLMNKVMPDDPDVQALVATVAEREAAGESWAALKMVGFQENLHQLDDIILKDGNVAVDVGMDGKIRLDPKHRQAIEEIRDTQDQMIEWERANGLDPQEIIGQRDAYADLPVGRHEMTFAEMYERVTEGFYFPKDIIERDGFVQIKGKLDPFTVANRHSGFADDVPEMLATVQTNMAAGTVYGANIAQVFEDRILSGQRRGNAKFFSEMADDPLFGGRSLGPYIDDKLPGVRAGIVYKQGVIATERIRLEKLITKNAERGRAQAKARRGHLRAKQLSKRLSSVEEQELRTLDAVEAVRLSVLDEAPPNAKGFRDAKRLVNRPVAKILKDTETGLERLQEASDQLDKMTTILDEAFDAKLISESEVAASKLKLERFRSSVARDKGMVAELKAMASEPQAGRVTVPRLGNRSFPETVGRSLNTALTPTTENAIIRQIGSFNNVTRAMMATMDLSAMGIQGLMALGAHPIQASGAMLTAWRSLKDPAIYADYLTKRKPLMENFIRMGGHFAADNTGEFAIPLALRKIPGVGGVANKSDLAFTRTGNLLRLTMFEQALEGRGMRNLGAKGALTADISDKEARAIVRTINAATGFSNSKPTSWEKVGLFAPRFFRSQLDLASKAMIKGGPDADYARTLLFKTFMMGTAITFAANAARGEKTDLNPIRQGADGALSYNSNFMRIKNLRGADVSVFGAWDSLLGLMTTTAIQGPNEGFQRLFRTKASPLSSTVQDIVNGETFSGQRVDISTPQGFANAILTESLNKLPFTAQDTLEGWKKGEYVPTGAAFNFFGVKSSPTTIFEQRDTLARDMFGETWTNLTGQEREAIEKARPQLFEDIAKQDKDRAALGDVDSTARLEREKIDVARISEEAALGTAVVSGHLSINDFTDRMNVLQTSSADQKRRVDSVLGINYGESTNPNQRALGAWYDLADSANIPGTGIRDWDLWEQLEASFMQTLSPEQARFIEERSRSEHAPEVDWFYQAKDVVSTSGYYSTVDNSFEQFRAMLPGEGIDSYSDLLNALAKAKAIGDVSSELQLNAVVNAIQTTSGAQKELLRIGNPALDQALLTLGRVSKPLAVQP